MAVSIANPARRCWIEVTMRPRCGCPTHDELLQRHLLAFFFPKFAPVFDEIVLIPTWGCSSLRIVVQLCSTVSVSCRPVTKSSTDSARDSEAMHTVNKNSESNWTVCVRRLTTSSQAKYGWLVWIILVTSSCWTTTASCYLNLTWMMVNHIKSIFRLFFKNSNNYLMVEVESLECWGVVSLPDASNRSAAPTEHALISLWPRSELWIAPDISWVSYNFGKPQWHDLIMFTFFIQFSAYFLSGFI